VQEAEAGVPYLGDERRVLQILVNLLSNAIKFTDPGGTITVTSLVERAGAAQSWAVLTVTDTGIGIPAEQRQRVFEPFHQVESGRTRRAGGTGLGLSISRQLARLMGGDLTVESEPARGSIFTLRLQAPD
jgi:signal transduction histidine kinase